MIITVYDETGYHAFIFVFDFSGYFLQLGIKSFSSILKENKIEIAFEKFLILFKV